MFSIDLERNQQDEKDTTIADLYEAGCTGIIEVSDSHLRAFFDDDSQQHELQQRFGGDLAPADLRDWVAFAHEFLKPMEIGERIFICPEWRDDPTPEGRIRIVVNAGLAFGTGAHETTRLCLEALERHITRDTRREPRLVVLDVGTGSGILAEAAIKLGAQKVYATDNDPEAVTVAAENFAKADVDITLSGDPIESYPTAIADIVVANISPAWISDLAPEWLRVLRPGGTAILSGFEAADLPRVTAALQQAGGRITAEFAANEWRMLELKKGLN
jgi:ribosomal protein L11 methyltransferase